MSDCSCIKNALFLQSSLLFEKGEHPNPSNTSSFNTDQYWSRTKSTVKMLFAAPGGFSWGVSCVLSPAWPSQDSAWRRLGIIWGPSGETHAQMRSLKQCAPRSSLLFLPPPFKIWCKSCLPSLRGNVAHDCCEVGLLICSAFSWAEIPPLDTLPCEEPSADVIMWLTLLAGCLRG